MSPTGWVPRVGWAAERPDVRAVLITSTRAVAGANVDAYSDFDVILVVSDVESLVANTRWLGDFGPVRVAYWDPVSAVVRIPLSRLTPDSPSVRIARSTAPAEADHRQLQDLA